MVFSFVNMNMICFQLKVGDINRIKTKSNQYNDG